MRKLWMQVVILALCLIAVLVAKHYVNSFVAVTADDTGATSRPGDASSTAVELGGPAPAQAPAPANEAQGSPEPETHDVQR